MTTASDYPHSIGIMYPASWPQDDPNAHCTVVYLGEIDEVPFSKDDLLAALKDTHVTAPGEVSTAGLEFFGPDQDIPVVLIDSLFTRLQKKIVMKALNEQGIEDASSFSQYRPHVTVLDPESEIPPSLTLGAPELWWGMERIPLS